MTLLRGPGAADLEAGADNHARGIAGEEHDRPDHGGKRADAPEGNPVQCTLPEGGSTRKGTIIGVAMEFGAMALTRMACGARSIGLVMLWMACLVGQ